METKKNTLFSISIKFSSTKKASSLIKDSSSLSNSRFGCCFCCSFDSFKSLVIVFWNIWVIYGLWKSWKRVFCFGTYAKQFLIWNPELLNSILDKLSQPSELMTAIVALGVNVLLIKNAKTFLSFTCCFSSKLLSKMRGLSAANKD